MMRSSWVSLAIVGTLTMALGVAYAQDNLQERSWNQLSERTVSDWGQTALVAANAGSSVKWKHGETEHFIIHFFYGGDMIARRSELFYADIRDFFGNRRDLLAGHKSHIFAFHDRASWGKFMHQIMGDGIMANAIGITRGNEFFYLAVGDDGRFDIKGKTQAHEMTHLVFNRFFAGRPPLWLNEGIAEYFGQRKTTDLVTFRHEMGRAPKFDVDQLFMLTMYPRDMVAVQAFYAESAIVVDFLTNTEPRRLLLPRFVDSILADHDIDKAVTVYGYRNLAEFENDYKHYRRRF